jgi:aspartate/glutamate racemase
MTDKKPELSDAMKKKLEPKKFTKNPILGTKFTLQFQVQREELENRHLQQILH